jgi:polysaccharide deacetylase family protein (PEP-CTERM system associated)
VGCHTHTHRPLWEHTPESLRREIRDFKSALFEVAGDLPVRGFRAPTFSLDTRTAWALRVLEEEGFTYDSSIVPVRGPLYGCPGAPLGVYRPSREDLRAPGEDGALVEFPAPLARWGGKSIPVGGGFYLRTLPFFLYQGLVRGVLRRRPFFLYVHPWETDPATPRIQIPRLARWATYAGIRGALGKIDHLLRTIRFTTMQSVIQAAGFGV